MFSDITPGGSGLRNGLHRDAKLSDVLRKLALRRQPGNTPTNDVAAAFKEGERSPIREAGGMAT